MSDDDMDISEINDFAEHIVSHKFPDMNETEKGIQLKLVKKRLQDYIVKNIESQLEPQEIQLIEKAMQDTDNFHIFNNYLTDLFSTKGIDLPSLLTNFASNY